MNASITKTARVIDFSQQVRTSPNGAILSFVFGIKGRRQNAVTMAEIQRWFKATPKDVTAKNVDRLVDNGFLVQLRTSCNRKRTSYIYDITESGMTLIGRAA